MVFGTKRIGLRSEARNGMEVLLTEQVWRNVTLQRQVEKRPGRMGIGRKACACEGWSCRWHGEDSQKIDPDQDE